ncbi:MAG: hypothetical protein JW983_03395 [Elusimicrobia bacterium]|nr:hypothetical protein [Elusimicrobiota bacterium]
MSREKDNRFRICPVCNKKFLRNKYSPWQKVCSKNRCQKIRQLSNLKKWRKVNLKYFAKYFKLIPPALLEKYKKIKMLWQKRHPGYLKNWRARHNKNLEKKKS